MGSLDVVPGVLLLPRLLPRPAVPCEHPRSCMSYALNLVLSRMKFCDNIAHLHVLTLTQPDTHDADASPMTAAMEMRTFSFHFRHQPAFSSCDSDDEVLILSPRLARLCSPTPSLSLDPPGCLLPVAQALLPFTGMFKISVSCSLTSPSSVCQSQCKSICFSLSLKTSCMHARYQSSQHIRTCCREKWLITAVLGCEIRVYQRSASRCFLCVRGDKLKQSLAHLTLSDKNYYLLLIVVI
jgi:hypothetical protein